MAKTPLDDLRSGLVGRLIASVKATQDSALSSPELRLLKIAVELFQPAMVQVAIRMGVTDIGAAGDDFHIAAIRKALQLAAAVDDPLRDLRQAMEDA